MIIITDTTIRSDILRTKIHQYYHKNITKIPCLEHCLSLTGDDSYLLGYYYYKKIDSKIINDFTIRLNGHSYINIWNYHLKY